jgi:hypothetical protein
MAWWQGVERMLEGRTFEWSNAADFFISILNHFWVIVKYLTVTVFNSNVQKETKIAY